MLTVLMGPLSSHTRHTEASRRAQGPVARLLRVSTFSVPRGRGFLDILPPPNQFHLAADMRAHIDGEFSCRTTSAAED